MAEVDFSDLDSVKAWFGTQSVATRCVMTSRAAMRVAASLGLADDRFKGRLALTSLRAMLTAARRGVCDPAEVEDLEKAANSTFSAAYSATDTADDFADAADAFGADENFTYFDAPCARSAARSATYSAASVVSVAAAIDSVAAAADSAVYSARSAARSAADSAAAAFDAEHVADSLFTKPVWAGAETPEAIATNHLTFLAYLDSHPDWAFWRRWYEGMWQGTFADWDLAIAVALIPDEVWEGDDALAKVAKRIREIEAKLKLQRDITALRAELEDVRRHVTQPAVGHNQGPPLDDTASNIHQQFDLVWPVLDELEEEVEKPEPNPERLQKLAKQLWEISKVVIGYCGGKIDIALNKAAETVGTTGTKWAIRTGVAMYAGTNEGVQNVAISAWKYAMALLS